MIIFSKFLVWLLVLHGPPERAQAITWKLDPQELSQLRCSAAYLLGNDRKLILEARTIISTTGSQERGRGLSVIKKYLPWNLGWEFARKVAGLGFEDHLLEIGTGDGMMPRQLSRPPGRVTLIDAHESEYGHVRHSLREKFDLRVGYFEDLDVTDIRDVTLGIEIYSGLSYSFEIRTYLRKLHEVMKLGGEYYALLRSPMIVAAKKNTAISLDVYLRKYTRGFKVLKGAVVNEQALRQGLLSNPTSMALTLSDLSNDNSIIEIKLKKDSEIFDAPTLKPLLLRPGRPPMRLLEMETPKVTK